MGFPGVSSGKEPTAMQEMQKKQVRFLSWEDPLDKGMETHSYILARRIP